MIVMRVLAMLLSDVYRVVKAFDEAFPNAPASQWLELHDWRWVAVGPYGRRVYDVTA